MSTGKVDKVQMELAKTIFASKKDPKKAAGRALGTIQEIIVMFLLEIYGLGPRLLLEYRLPEYGDADILHNVEFTIHPLRKIERRRLEGHENLVLKLPPEIFDSARGAGADIVRSVTVLECHRELDRLVRIINPCFIRNLEKWKGKEVYLARCSEDRFGELITILSRPVAFVESKRVGLEEGTATGPQTIEKAKQASYVALKCSKLQKIVTPSATLGIIAENERDVRYGNYDEIWKKMIQDGDRHLMDGVVRSVIFLSDYINWYVGGVEKKDLRIIRQSYDWTIWIDDEALGCFVTDLIQANNTIREAFSENYTKRKRGGTFFTKNRLDDNVYHLLIEYFQKNRRALVDEWLKVLSPRGKTFEDLVKELNAVLHVFEC